MSLDDKHRTADFEKYRKDIAIYTDKVNDVAVHGLIKTYRLVMSKTDSRFVACSDREEKATVRTNFLKKKLGLSLNESELDAAIEEVCLKMKGDRTKLRTTFYYLLAEKYNKLDLFS